MRWVLVRHVETVGNVEKRFNGVTESPYTEFGLAMKEQLVTKLTADHKETPFDRIFASPIKRAWQIAEAVGEEAGLTPVSEVRIKEYNFGIFEGLTAAEAQAKAPEHWQAWMADYNHYPLPGGDLYEVYHRSIGEFIAEVRGSGAENVLVVAHGGSVQSLLVQLLGLPLDDRWHFAVHLGGIAVIAENEGFGMLESLYTPDYQIQNKSH